MKRLVWIGIYFELVNNKHDSAIVYPDKPNFALKVCYKFIKYILSGSLRYIHFSYHFKVNGKLMEETKYTIRDIVDEWIKETELPFDS